MMKHDEALRLYWDACDLLAHKAKCFEGELSDNNCHFASSSADIQFSVLSDAHGYFLCAVCWAQGETRECNVDLDTMRGVSLFLDRSLGRWFRRIHGTYQQSLFEVCYE